jgi:hypothetical protein
MARPATRDDPILAGSAIASRHRQGSLLLEEPLLPLLPELPLLDDPPLLEPPLEDPPLLEPPELLPPLLLPPLLLPPLLLPPVPPPARYGWMPTGSRRDLPGALVGATAPPPAAGATVEVEADARWAHTRPLTTAPTGWVGSFWHAESTVAGRAGSADDRSSWLA